MVRFPDLGGARQHFADRRGRVGIDVEVVGQVALRVEVDGQNAQPDAAEDVRQRTHRRGLAGAALLRENVIVIAAMPAAIYNLALRANSDRVRRLRLDAAAIPETTGMSQKCRW